MFCLKCGKEYKEDTKFCADCGAPRSVEIFKDQTEAMDQEQKPTNTGKPSMAELIEKQGIKTIGIMGEKVSHKKGIVILVIVAIIAIFFLMGHKIGPCAYCDQVEILRRYKEEVIRYGLDLGTDEYLCSDCYRMEKYF